MTDDLDSPESFLKGLPPTQYYWSQELKKAGFEYSNFFGDTDDDNPPLGDMAWSKRVRSPGVMGRGGIVTIRRDSENPDRPTADVIVTDITGRVVAHYLNDVPYADAAKSAMDLVVKLERNELEIVNGKFYPVQESMRTIDERGRHRAGCECGFCKNMGSFGKKKDDDAGEAKDEKQPANEARNSVRRKAPLTQERRASKIVSDLLEDGQ